MKDTMTILKEAWGKTLATDYQSGVLYIERDLQAAFYHYARILSKDELTLFNEFPGFLGHGKPDLVVCRDSVVEAVIEFKFDVCRVGFVEDLTKLARWANTVGKDPSQPRYLALDPKTVTLDYERPFIISAKSNWVFAAVTKAGEDAVSSAAIKKCLHPKRKNVPWSRFWHFTGTVQANGELRSAARHL